VKTLSLHFKQLTSVPTELGTFAALEKLNLDNNQLTSMPAGPDIIFH
jgi:Leucine-rich repeat (LRR) protein